jgi:hypothetical protein
MLEGGMMASLNGHAYTDDRQFILARVQRRWARGGEREHMFIAITPATLYDAERAA